MSTPEEIISDLGPCPSSVVAVYLINTCSLSCDAARKRINRFPPSIRRLQIGLPNRECFLYLDEQWKTPHYFERLTEAIKENGGALARSIIALEARNGLVDRQYFAAAAGLPIIPVKKQLSYDTTVDRLVNLGLIQLESIKDQKYVRLSCSDDTHEHSRAIAIAEGIALSALKSWLIKLGFSSEKTISLRGDKPGPSFGPFAWDLVTPTYLAGIAPRTSSDVKNGFVVADAFLGKRLSITDLGPIFYKYDTVLAQRKHRNFLPLLIADYLEESALRELRKRGFIIGVTANLFGEDIAKALRELISTIHNAAAAVTKNPDDVFQLIGKLSAIEGAAGNLRGAVLELIVGHLYHLKGYRIDIRQKVQASNGEKAEIDVKATNAQETVCVECKAKTPGKLVEFNEVQEWVERKIPRIKDWLNQSHNGQQKKRFEFYVSSDYEDEALAYVKKEPQRHKRHPISFLTGRDIIRELENYHQTSIVRMFTGSSPRKMSQA